jgi:hypothetical protein
MHLTLPANSRLNFEFQMCAMRLATARTLIYLTIRVTSQRPIFRSTIDLGLANFCLMYYSS